MGLLNLINDKVNTLYNLCMVVLIQSFNYLQVPPELTRSNSPVVNKGQIYISKTSSGEVVDAYSNQFRRDFSTFLKFRSEEITAGGHMVLTFKGRRSADPSDDESCLLWDYLSMSLQHLVKQVSSIYLMQIRKPS